MRKLCFSLFILSLVVAGNAQTSENMQLLRQMSDGFAELAAQVKPGVVKITTEGTEEGRIFDLPWGRPFRVPDQERRGQGSGVVAEFEGQQYIITNNHVIRRADDIRVEATDSRFFEAEVVGRDSLSDVAVLRIDAEDLPTLTLGDSDQLREGEWVMAIGNPLGFAHSVTMGTVSALGRDRFGPEYGSFIQTDAALNKGNSGGALVNLRGELVGINTAITSNDGGNIGIGFAIPINLVKHVAEQLIEHGEVRRGLLGVRIGNLEPLLAEAMGLDNTQGVLITSVNSGRAADKAGVKRDDIVLEVDGQPVHNAVDLRSLIGSTAPGVEVELLVLRDGKQKRIKVELEALTEEVLATTAGTRDSNEARGPLGIRVENLKDEWAERLGYEDEAGVMVVRVARGSEAAKRGLLRGMLIQEINDERVENVEDYEDALAEIEPGDAFMMRVLGQRGTRLIGMRMPVN
ncbi:MAG: Do family serine endopeptidase [Gemmatimonadetes bacterium]|nr:Do family serine endopeptidase [Gemmatimonadota bacterium]MYI62115.1 Do family serine endopeptidase [Gemmatimonadota bacterium]